MSSCRAAFAGRSRAGATKPVAPHGSERTGMGERANPGGHRSQAGRPTLLRLSILAFGLVAAGGLASCGGGASKARSPSTVSPVEATRTVCGTYSGRGCAPTGKRVDLVAPTFSDPTRITNPLFPISQLHSAVLLGQVNGEPFRSETTLLPEGGTVTWRGRKVPVLLSQYAAFVDGRIEEVALDRYAQADDGSVWYLGEDVFDYKNGAVAVTEGTWLAGRDGPAAMIMPAAPAVGNAFRPEDVTGVVFEELSVRSVDRTVDGPRGPVAGAITGDELHLDGHRSPKTFAPGYGEFRTVDGRDVEALALAVPIDAVPGPPPLALSSLSTSASAILENARLGDWDAAEPTLGRMSGAWRTLLADQPPPLIADRMNVSLRALTRAVGARRPAETEQAAIDVARSALDLELRHRPPVQIDIARFHLWSQQLRVDAAAKDLAGVAGDVAVLEWMRDRITASLDPAGLQELDAGLRGLRAAADARNLPAAADHAARLAARLRNLTTPPAG